MLIVEGDSTFVIDKCSLLSCQESSNSVAAATSGVMPSAAHTEDIQMYTALRNTVAIMVKASEDDEVVIEFRWKTRRRNKRANALTRAAGGGAGAVHLSGAKWLGLDADWIRKLLRND